MDMIGWDGQLHHRPVVFCCDCADDLLQPIPYRPYQHLAAPLGTTNDVVDYQMDIVPLVLIIHSYSMPQNNTVCKDRGPFISRLKPGAFWPISVTLLIVHGVSPAFPCPLASASQCAGQTRFASGSAPSQPSAVSKRPARTASSPARCSRRVAARAKSAAASACSTASSIRSCSSNQALARRYSSAYRPGSRWRSWALHASAKRSW